MPLAFAGLASAQNPVPPVAPAPPGNPVTSAKANLGKVLFWDEQMSSNGSVACGTCHVPGSSGSDPRTAQSNSGSVHPGVDHLYGTADDIHGSLGITRALGDSSYDLDSVFRLERQVTPRRSQGVVNSGFLPLQFWSGRAQGSFNDPITGAVVIAQGATLEIQCLEPVVSKAEMSHVGRTWSEVAQKIATCTPLRLASNIPPALANWINSRSYPTLFEEAFGTGEVTPVRIAMAIATYERTLCSNQSPFDAFVAGNSSALSQLEQQGLQVFNGPGRCNVCHSGPLQTDNVFHYTGIRPHSEDRGRAYVTGLDADKGAMKTPSLRNVELRAPYFHNGGMASLSDVIDFYDRGGDFSASNKPPQIAPIGFTPQQKIALLAFLKRPLTDPRVAAEAFPFDHPTLFSQTNAVPAHYGAPSAGSGGFLPTLVGFEPAMIGNPSWTVGIDHGNAGKQAILLRSPIASISGVPFQGAVLHVSLGIQTQVTRIGGLHGFGPGDGWGSATVAIANNALLIGQQFFAQWLVLDPQGGGRRFAASDAVAVTYL